jgi:hypothetical protein
VLDKPIPLFAVDLIKELDESIPSGIPTLGESLEVIWTNAALRHFIDGLKLRLKLQEENSLSKGTITT